MRFTIEWVNHASFVLEHQDVRLICDPWIEGTAFDHGWKHLVPTSFSYEDFASVTHIWISHEHPDHFAPKNLQAIPADIRARITVLFHEAVDHRIGLYCRNAGFQEVIELRTGQWCSVSDGLQLRCEESGSGDTWLAARSAEQLVLNINDGYLAHRWRLDRIRRAIGRDPDVLLTQFSYANWEGNPEDREARRAVALEHLGWMRLQAEALRPRWIIPFASMVWFCHEENFYLNDEMNTVDGAYRFLEEVGPAAPITLFPGERWTIGDRHDSERSLALYAPYYERLGAGAELVRSPSVDAAELARLAIRFFRLLRRHNPPWALWLARRLRLLRPARIYVWDHSASYVLSPERGLETSDVPRSECDVSLGSESLAYMLRFLWGGATVHVNGRFRTEAGGDFRRFSRYLLIANYNNRGWSMLRYLPVALGRIRDRISGRAEGGAQRSMG